LQEYHELSDFINFSLSNFHEFLKSVKSTDPKTKTIQWKSVQFFSWLNVLRIHSCIKFILIISRIFSHCLKSCLMHTLSSCQISTHEPIFFNTGCSGCSVTCLTVTQVYHCYGCFDQFRSQSFRRCFLFLLLGIFTVSTVCCRNEIQKRQCAGALGRTRIGNKYISSLQIVFIYMEA